MAKEVLTTGDIGKLCGVSPRTATKWIDSGRLRGFRIPGSKDRRVLRSELEKFAIHHGVPIDGVVPVAKVIEQPMQPDLLRT